MSQTLYELLIELHTSGATTAAAEVNTVGDAVQKTGVKTEQASHKVGGLGSSFKNMIAGTIGLLGISAAGHSIYENYEQAEQATKRTAAAIQTAGAASWASVDGIEALSKSLEHKDSIDFQQIQGNANLLLSYRNIRNEVGAGNDVFNQAVAVTQDLAATMQISGTSAAKQLGRALSDPLQGLTSLHRAGITFTQSQKDQVAAMMATGDTLGAQKVLLDEVAAHTRGAAAAAGTPLSQLHVAWNDLSVALATTFAPAFAQVIGAITNAVTAIQPFVSHLQPIMDFLQPAAPLFVALAVAITAASVAMWAWDAANLADPWTWVLIAVVALAVGVIHLYNTNKTFRDDLGKLGSALVSVGNWFGNAGHNIHRFWTGFRNDADEVIDYVTKKLDDGIKLWDGTIGKLGGHFGIPDLKIGALVTRTAGAISPIPVPTFATGPHGHPAAGALAGISGGTSAPGATHRAQRPVIENHVHIGGSDLNREIVQGATLAKGYQ